MLSLFHVGHNYWHPIIATSFSQGNSSEFSPIMPEEFGEHLTRDQRLFSSYSISPGPSDSQLHASAYSLQFTHSFSVGFRSEDRDSNGKRFILCSVTHFYIYIYIYAFSRRFYPKRLTVHSVYTFVLSVCVFPGNRTHNLYAANAML